MKNFPNTFILELLFFDKEFLSALQELASIIKKQQQYKPCYIL